MPAATSRRVPVHQAERSSAATSGPEKRLPAVNRLGTADRQLVKERARRAVADIADDLLKLPRRARVGERHSFSPDGPWQDQELAALLPMRNDDQLDAIDEVTRDMESERLMDRLTMAYGYGKTEVRCAVLQGHRNDGKQVAMLVPTTVLAQQHFRTLSNRLNRFPVRVDAQLPPARPHSRSRSSKACRRPHRHGGGPIACSRP